VVQWLPAYAPDLNPLEQIWNCRKNRDLANLAPADAEDRRAHVQRSLIGQRGFPSADR